MGKWRKRRAGLSGFLAVAIVAGSFSAGAAVQERTAVYEGALICGQEEHTHNRSCYEQASPSDAKGADSDLVGGLEEHVHDSDCYESEEEAAGTLTPPEALPDQTPGSEGSAQENGKTESSGMEGTEPEENDSEEKNQEEVDQEGAAALRSAALERSGNMFLVHTFGELQAAIKEVNKEEDGGDFQIVLEDDIEWDDEITVSAAAYDVQLQILLDMNGHSIRILTEDALWVHDSSLTIQGKIEETIIIASSLKDSGGYYPYIIAGGGNVVLDNVKVVAEDSQKELPPLIRMYGSCTLNDVTVENYLVHGSLCELESSYGEIDPPTALTIQGGSFSGIRSDGSGAVVGAVCEQEDDHQWYHPGRIEIHDAVFKNNSAKNGGAVEVFSENGLEITDSVFENNQATDGDGGAVYINGWYSGWKEDTYVNIDRSTFTDNDATGKGGAIYCEVIDLSIANGTFEANKASDGGAVAITDASNDALIHKTTFTGNRAENSGGAIYADSIYGSSYSNTVRMEEVTLRDNKAGKRGGAVCMEEDTDEDYEQGGTGQFELILYDAVITGNHGPENGHAVECMYSLQMEGGRCPAVFDNDPVALDGIYLPSSAEAGSVYGTMLGEGDAGLEILYESGADKQTLHKGETAVIDPSSDGAIRLAFHPSGKEGILALSPVVLMEGNEGGDTGSAIYGTSITFITSEKKAPEEPEPEKPEPEKPKPEKPEPEKPEPEKPEPEKPKPERPGSGSSSGGSGSSSSGGGGSVSRSEGSSSDSGMSITKPHYIHSAAGGREMSDTRPGWRLRKPDGSYAASEWVWETDGFWYLYGEDGYTCSGWQRVNGEWYFFDETAQNMKTGWLIRGGKWYYLDPVNGPMKTGWILLEGKWYFLSPDGALVTNGYTPDGYYVDDNGEWKEKVMAGKSR